MILIWVFCFLLSSLALSVTADGIRPLQQPQPLLSLQKREDKLPYDTLPITNCSVPSVCSNIGQPVSCRCSSLLTICIDNDRRFCWGSVSLTQSTDCPTIPESCSSQFNGTASCLCNQDAVLCVDGYNHYCYGTYSGPASTASVALQPIPSSSPPTSSSSFSPSSPQSASSSSSSSGNNTSSSGGSASASKPSSSVVGLAMATLLTPFMFHRWSHTFLLLLVASLFLAASQGGPPFPPPPPPP